MSDIWVLLLASPFVALLLEVLVDQVRDDLAIVRQVSS